MLYLMFLIKRLVNKHFLSGDLETVKQIKVTSGKRHHNREWFV